MSDLGFDELNALAADLTELANIVPREVKKSVQQAAIETKKDYSRDAKASMPKSIARRYAPAIDYTLREYGAFGQGVFEAEIGPNLTRYGGKSGKGGLLPSFGFLDDPDKESGIRSTPSRSRNRAEKFAEKAFPEKLELAVSESHRKAGL